jgi:glycosyltransferase involved in cell wall biosynthesis
LNPALGDASKRSPGAPIDVLWLAEPYAGHDPAVALEAVRVLRSEGEDVRITVCGEQAYGFDPDDGQLTLSAVPARARRAAESIACETVADERELARVLSRAKMVWSSALADGEAEGVLRAAQVGVPYVGLRYPQAERLVEELGVEAFFYDRSEAGLIADALKRGLSNALSAPASGASMQGDMRDWSSVVERLWSPPVA